jgi:hypothetical protein
VDQPLQHATVLQNLCSGGVAVVQPSTKPDDQKSASELAQKPQTILHSLHFQLASIAVHSEIIASDIQALLFCGGPTLSLQHYGRIVTPLPPIDNWTKGSSLNGPNAGIPLAVHSLALDVQHLMDSVVYYFGATNAKVLKRSYHVTPSLPSRRNRRDSQSWPPATKCSATGRRTAYSLI